MSRNLGTEGEVPLENNNLTTTELVNLSQKGDINAFSQLVQIYESKILGLCFKLTGNKSDAEDLAQETFLKAYQKINTFRNEADFGTWLHRIAVNLYLNQKKKDNKMELSYLDTPIKTDKGEFNREIMDEGNTPLEEIEKIERQNSIKEALNDLKPKHKLVLVLRELEGYSYEEIAQMTQTSLGTVKSRMNRARQALKEKLFQQKDLFP